MFASLGNRLTLSSIEVSASLLPFPTLTMERVIAKLTLKAKK